MMKRILLVEDNPDIALSVIDILEDEGFEVTRAADAEGALASMRRGAPDLLVLDIRLPGRSGISLYREIKLDKMLKDVPALFVSAFSIGKDFTGDRFRVLVPEEEIPPPEGFLEKPFRPETLVGAVRSIVFRQG